MCPRRSTGVARGHGARGTQPCARAARPPVLHGSATALGLARPGSPRAAACAHSANARMACLLAASSSPRRGPALRAASWRGPALRAASWRRSPCPGMARSGSPTRVRPARPRRGLWSARLCPSTVCVRVGSAAPAWQSAFPRDVPPARLPAQPCVACLGATCPGVATSVTAWHVCRTARTR